MDNNQSTAGANACRARAVGGTNLVECLAEALYCHWHIPFGGRKFCGHPCNILIAEGVPQEDWPDDAPKVG